MTKDELGILEQWRNLTRSDQRRAMLVRVLGAWTASANLTGEEPAIRLCADAVVKRVMESPIVAGGDLYAESLLKHHNAYMTALNEVVCPTSLWDIYDASALDRLAAAMILRHRMTMGSISRVGGPGVSLLGALDEKFYCEIAACEGVDL